MKTFIMKRVLCAMMFVASACLAYAESVTVNLTREGTLAEKVLEQASSLATVTELTVKGKINSSDWNCIVVQMSNLSTLDMKGATASFPNITSFNDNITTFLMPEGIKKLSCDMERLRYIEISNSVENIGGNEWHIFEDLQTIKFGRGLKSITCSPFEFVTNLTDIYIYDLSTWCVVSFDRPESSPFFESPFYDGQSSQRLYVNDELVTRLVIPEVKSINPYAFYNCRAIQSIEIAEGCKTIGSNAFYGCTNVSSINLPSSLNSIGTSAFGKCINLSGISLPTNLKTLSSGVFSMCSALQSIVLPSSLTKIGSSAFSGCTSLTEISFPESITSIGYSAFSGCSGLTKVTCLIPFPISASSGIFSGINQEACTLVVPEWSALLYKMAIGWSEFSKIETVPTGDLALLTVDDTRYLPESVRPNGTPNVFISENGSLTVRGGNAFDMNELTLNMKIGTSQRRWGYDENGNYREYYTPSLYGSCLFNDESNLTAKGAKLGLKSSGATWGFITLPFDANLSEITPMVEGDVNNFIWKTYDGERRALVGTGGNWIEAEGTLKAGVGYIYQSQKEDSIYVKALASSLTKMLGSADITLPLTTYAANDPEDESWNFIGNPYPTYFNTHYIDFTAPITVWNGNGYDAISLTDDDYTLAPCQAFFVQKQSDTDNIKFFAEGRTTEYSQSNNNYYYARKRVAQEATRNIVNLYLAGNDYKDKSRIVFNEDASIDYELSCDATKFMSENNDIPQLYSVDDKGRQYAINERPVGNGNVNLGIAVPESGEYTISVDKSKLTSELYLIDTKENVVTDLTTADYTFYSDAVTSNSRFVLSLSNNVTGISGAENTTSRITIADGGIVITGACGQRVEIYSLDGKCIYNGYTNRQSETITMAKGAYVVKVGDKSLKTIIK